MVFFGILMGFNGIEWDIYDGYPLVNEQLDPENHPFLVVSLIFQAR